MALDELQDDDVVVAVSDQIQVVVSQALVTLFRGLTLDYEAHRWPVGFAVRAGDPGAKVCLL